MRKDLPVLGLTFLLLFGVSQPEARADLRFSEPVVELGWVRSGVPLTHRFRFVCDQGPAEITDVRTSCGCVRPRVPKHVYQRGEEGLLAVELHTLTQPAGSHIWRIQVFYRVQGAAYEMALQLKADVVREVTVEPAALVLFGDRAIQREVLVKDIRTRPLLIQSVRGSSPALTARVEPPTRDGDGRWQCKILVDLRPEASAGRREEVLSIFTDDPDYRELRIPVAVVTKTAQELTVTPSEVTLTAPAGQPIPSQRVLVRHRDQRSVTIEKVEAGDPSLQVQWAQGEQRVGVVKVSVDRSRFQGGQVKTLLHIHVSQPVREVLAVPVSVSAP